MYTLTTNFDRGAVVIGCGGTGGFVAEGLCRLLPADWRLVLVDGDHVEESNLVRQNFYREDLGRFKSQALAERLARRFDRPVGYGLEYLLKQGNYNSRHLPRELDKCGLVIGCVDNALARGAIADAVNLSFRKWWVDAGNADNWGQVLIGNGVPHNGAFSKKTDTCHHLPLPTEQRPQLLLPALVEEPDPDCAEAVEMGDQSATINQAMAALVLEVVRRLILGTCPWMSLFLDLETGELKPTYATPEVVARLTERRVSQLMYRD